MTHGMKISPCIIILALLCTSCNYSFDLKGLDGKGKIYVTCISRGADTTVFDVRTTVSISDVPDRPLPVTSSRASLTVNGSGAELLRSDGSVPGVAEGSFYTLDRFSSGDVLEFRASVDGLDDVSARTQVPGSFPEVSVDAGLEMYEPDDYSESLRLTVKFMDDPSEEDFYGIIVKSRVTYDAGGSLDPADMPFKDYESYPYVILPDDNDESSSKERVLHVDYDLRNSFEGSVSDVQLILWDDVGFNGGTASLDLFLNHEPDYYFTFQGARVECRTEYRLLLLKLSPEAYYAAKACYICMHNSYGDIGLSSPAFIYSNVIGGIGYFGAMHQSESDWIGNPGEMIENQPYIQ